MKTLRLLSSLLFGAMTVTTVTAQVTADPQPVTVSRWAAVTDVSQLSDGDRIALYCPGSNHNLNIYLQAPSSSADTLRTTATSQAAPNGTVPAQSTNVVFTLHATTNDGTTTYTLEAADNRYVSSKTSSGTGFITMTSTVEDRVQLTITKSTNTGSGYESNLFWIQQSANQSQYLNTNRHPGMAWATGTGHGSSWQIYKWSVTTPYDTRVKTFKLKEALGDQTTTSFASLAGKKIMLYQTGQTPSTTGGETSEATNETAATTGDRQAWLTSPTMAGGLLRWTTVNTADHKPQAGDDVATKLFEVERYESNATTENTDTFYLKSVATGEWISRGASAGKSLTTSDKTQAAKFVAVTSGLTPKVDDLMLCVTNGSWSGKPSSGTFYLNTGIADGYTTYSQNVHGLSQWKVYQVDDDKLDTATTWVHKIVEDDTSASPTTLPYVGHDAGELAKSPDPYMQHVYLYNVGTGSFLTKNGGRWGTEAVLGDQPVQFTIQAVDTTTSTFALKSNMDATDENGRRATGKITYLTPILKQSTYDIFNVFTDNPGDTDGTEGATGVNPKSGQHQSRNLVFEKVNGTETGRTYYKIAYTVTQDIPQTTTPKSGLSGVEGKDPVPAGKYYMAGARYTNSTTSDGVTGVINMIPADATSYLTHKTDQWVLVTENDLRYSLLALKGDGSDSISATFQLIDPGFDRNDAGIDHWTKADGQALGLGVNGNYDQIRQSPSDAVSGLTYYVGNGLGGNVSEQQPHGGEWTANIHGTGGKLTQSFQPIRGGFYRISINAFTTAQTAGKVKFYAQVGNSTTNTYTAENNTVEGFKYTKASYAETAVKQAATTPASYGTANTLVNDGSHTASVVVYVEPQSSLAAYPMITFGVDATQADGTNPWTCLDNADVQFLGTTATLVVFLDEEQTSPVYLNTQNKYFSDNNRTSDLATVILNRTFNYGKWNTLVLPFDVDSARVSDIFGYGTIVLALEGASSEQAADKNLVVFRQPAGNAIVKNTLCLIRPQFDRRIALPEKLYPSAYALNEKQKEADTLFYSEGSNFTPVTGRILAVDGIQFYNAPTEKETDGNFYRTEIFTHDPKAYPYGTGDGIWFAGTWTKRATENDCIPANSVVLAGNQTGDATQGMFYYRIQKTATKGFRGWLGVKDAATAKQAKFSFLGVDEPIPTSIADQLAQPTGKAAQGVYNLQGQRVRQDASTEGLHGIFIVNGRKVVIK